MVAKAFRGVVVVKKLLFCEDGVDFGMADDVKCDRLGPFVGLGLEVMFIDSGAVDQGPAADGTFA